MNGFKLGAFGLSMLSALPVFAASPDVGVPLGSGWTLLPDLTAKYLHDSNLYRQDDNKTSANATIISPSIGAQYLTPGDSYKFGYDGEFGFYDSTSHDNYTNNSVYASADINQTGKNRLDLDAGRREGYDPRGTERTEDTTTANLDVDEFAVTTVKGLYTYGAPSATLNFSGGLDYLGKSYSNNKDFTKYLDYKSFGGLLGLRYRVSNATAALGDVQYHKISFDHEFPGTSTRDGNEIRARVGAQWQPASTLTGRALIGYFHRSTDASDRSDSSSVDYEFVVDYQPTSYTLFTVEGSHSTQEAYFAQSNFIDVQRDGGSWTQNWTDRFSTKLSAYYNRYKFEGFARTDNLYTGSAYADYDVSRYIGYLRKASIRLSFDIAGRNSSADTNPITSAPQSFDFSRNVTALSVNIGL